MSCAKCGAEFTPAYVQMRYCSVQCRRAMKKKRQRDRYVPKPSAGNKFIDSHIKEVLIEDAEFLLGQGEHPERVAKRLGYSCESLEGVLRRAGREDLAVQILAVTS